MHVYMYSKDKRYPNKVNICAWTYTCANVCVRVGMQVNFWAMLPNGRKHPMILNLF